MMVEGGGKGREGGGESMGGGGQSRRHCTPPRLSSPPLPSFHCRYTSPRVVRRCCASCLHVVAVGTRCVPYVVAAVVCGVGARCAPCFVAALLCAAVVVVGPWWWSWWYRADTVFLFWKVWPHHSHIPTPRVRVLHGSQFGYPYPYPWCSLLTSTPGITKPTIHHLAHRGGVKRISGLIYEETCGVLKIFLENVSRSAWFLLHHLTSL
jgi:hypothetical protein